MLSVLKHNGLQGVQSAPALLRETLGPNASGLVPVPVENVLKRIDGLECSIVLSDFQNLLKRSIVRVDRQANDEVKRVLIWINPTETRKERRFAIAHALGHLVRDVYPRLTQGSCDEMVDALRPDPVTKDDYRERQADGFAEALLMPCKLVAQEVGQLLENTSGGSLNKQKAVSHLAERFMVPEKRMEDRLAALGYLNN